MRRMLAACLTCAALAAVAVIPASASAGTHPPAGPHIYGAGVLNPFDLDAIVNVFAFDLRSNADGSNPTGFVTVFGYTIDSSGNRVLRASAGKPVCMKVVGDRATFVVKLPFVIGVPGLAGAKFWVHDNGRPADDDSPVDNLENDRLSDTQLARATCDTLSPDRGDHLINRGNITVQS
jgi:hypothetical protein